MLQTSRQVRELGREIHKRVLKGKSEVTAFVDSDAAGYDRGPQETGVVKLNADRRDLGDPGLTFRKARVVLLCMNSQTQRGVCLSINL